MMRAIDLQLAVAVLGEEPVRAALRRDAPGMALGLLFAVLGLAAVGVFRVRERSRDPSVLWFGLFAFLFGVRLLILSEIVRFATGVPDAVWFRVAAAISYVILLPALLFLREIFPAWRPWLAWLIGFQVFFAAAGLVSDQLLGRPESLGALNSALVLLGFLALVVALFRQSGSHTSIQTLRLGALIFAGTVVVRNLSNLHLLPVRLDLEPLGLAVFLAALARVVVLRVLAREEHLLALNKELEVARRIQESILPREVPRMARLAIAARYLPMTSVAGDFYEFLMVDSQRVGILVADVSGHGVPAALIASMVKIAIAAQAPHADDPAAVLAGMNATLCGHLQNQFVTAAYLLIDLRENRIRYSAAGHPPMLRYRRSGGTVDSLVENGLVLGLMPHAEYTCLDAPLAPGDRFLLYTDGLIEATDTRDEPFGDGRLQDLLASTASLTADQTATSVVDTLRRWTGGAGNGRQQDDLTVLVVDT